jgi:hypothetical protein
MGPDDAMLIAAALLTLLGFAALVLHEWRLLNRHAPGAGGTPPAYPSS